MQKEPISRRYLMIYKLIGSIGTDCFIFLSLCSGALGCFERRFGFSELVENSLTQKNQKNRLEIYILQSKSMFLLILKVVKVLLITLGFIIILILYYTILYYLYYNLEYIILLSMSYIYSMGFIVFALTFCFNLCFFLNLLAGFNLEIISH